MVGTCQGAIGAACPKTRGSEGKLSKKRALILSGGGARGAYQAGVWKYISESKWRPDIICGTSVGAINATAIGTGLNPDEIASIWRHLENRRVFKLSLWKKLSLFTGGRLFFRPLADTKPLQSLLERNLSLSFLQQNEKKIIISAVNIARSELKYFTNHEITISHILASCAIPVLFPWQDIQGETYWDGGVMANTPILPAIEEQAEDLIVVLLSPVGHGASPLPVNRHDALERIFEQMLIASYEAFLAHLRFETDRQRRAGISAILRRSKLSYKDLRIRTVAPRDFLGFHSIVNFSGKQADRLVSLGYHDAKEQLGKL